MSNNHEFDVIRCITDNTTLVKKSHIENFNTQAQLIVNESQEALFYKEGQALDLFGPGRHTLTTENLPNFKKFFHHLFGNGQVFPCEVFFINKVSVLDILWGTPTPIVLEDPQYHLIVNVKASGQMGLVVKDSRRFVVKVVGQLTEFGVDDIRRAVKGIMMTSLKTIIANTIINNKIGILEIATQLEELSQNVQLKLNEKLYDIGLEAVHFNIGTIFTDDKDIQTLKLAKERQLESMAETDAEAYKLRAMGAAEAAYRAAQGYTYQDEMKYKVLETAAGNAGTGGEFVSMGIGIGTGVGLAGEMRNQMNGAMSSIPQEPSAPTTQRKCPNCSAVVGDNAKFCQECGQALAPAKKFCPECGSQCEGTAKFCSICGNKL